MTALFYSGRVALGGAALGSLSRGGQASSQKRFPAVILSALKWV